MKKQDWSVDRLLAFSHDLRIGHAIDGESVTYHGSSDNSYSSDSL